MTTLTRRSRAAEPEETPRRARRGSSESEEKTEDERPRRSRRTRDEAPAEDEKPARRGRNRDEKRSVRRPAAGGFGGYNSKRKSTSKYATEFKPADNTKVLVKFLDAEPFDNFNQHWIDEMPKGVKKSYMCYDDPEYHSDAEEKGCPLCDLGDPASTYSLWNVLDLSSPRKPDQVVWKTSTAVTDKLQRIAESKRSQPLDRIDLYFEVEKVVKGKRTSWEITPLKADEAAEEYEFDAFAQDELSEYLEDRYTDRTSVTSVDKWDDLDEIAADL